MLDSFQILAIGAAVVIDTVLLMALIERPNRRFVTFWMLLLTAGAWLWHTGAFIHLLLEGATGPWAPGLHWWSMTMMAAGLLLMPSAMLHGLIRLWNTGLEAWPRPDPRLLALYLPLLVLVPISLDLRTDPTARFLHLVEPYVLPYVAWLAVFNSISAAGLLKLRRSFDLPRVQQFLLWMALCLIGMTVLILFVVLYALDAWAGAAVWLQLIVTLLPTVPALLFAYYVTRYRFLPVVLERTLVYGGVLIGLLLLHRVAVRDLEAAVLERYSVDFKIIEGAAAVLLILAYQPLRERTAEALRYLMGKRVSGVRDRIRKLALGMSARAGQPPQELLAWFTEAVRTTLGVEYACGWLQCNSQPIHAGSGQAAGVEERRLRQLAQDMAAANLRTCTPYDVTCPAAVDAVVEVQASIAVRIAHADADGVLLLGRQTLNQQLAEEEVNALLLLTEQLAGTISNSLLQAQRLAAERRALQNEKLSTLGLLAGSIAHEVKNPLSSIKTITAVLAEQLGQNSEHAEDLRLILGEIDRLTTTTAELLEFARPADLSETRISVGDVLERLLRIMRHFARQRDVAFEANFDDDLPPVCARENSIREIFFNLLSNSIDAAGRGGRVQLGCRRDGGFVTIEIHDNGPGIPPELQNRLFEPFFTTKESGTGLGLYVVGRRIHELGGEIHCRSEPGQGTTFTVRLAADNR